MISHVAVTDGYATALPAIKGKTFSFGPGLNILFGPNGCGKSTLLNIIAGYTACKGGGWSAVYGPDGFPSLDTDRGGKNFPSDIESHKCKARLEWDGTACYFNATAVSDAPITSFGMTDASWEEEISVVMGKPSDGQRRLTTLNKTFKKLTETPPDLTVPKRKSELEAAFAEWVKTLPRTGPNTVLLDEPDRSLSIENQAIVLSGLPNLAKRFQVIVTTHSPLLLLKLYGEDTNLIDMEKGYLEHSKRILDLYTKGEPFGEIMRVAQVIRMAEAKIAQEEAKKKDVKKDEPKPKRKKK